MLIYANPAIVQLPLGTPEGLTMISFTSNMASALAGRALIRRASGGRQMAVVASSMAKRLVPPWVEGSGSVNGLASGLTPTANTIYHYYLLLDANGKVDAYFDTSPIAANKPAGWDARMIGSVFLNNFFFISDFDQQDDRFEYRLDLGAADTNSLSTSSFNIVTLPTPSVASAFGTIVTFIPSGTANVVVSAEGGGASGSNWCTAMPGLYLQVPWQINGNRMRLYCSTGATNVTVAVRIRGFIHPRGSQG